MKLPPLVLALAGVALATVNAVPLRVTIVSSHNELGSAASFFDDPSPPSVRREEGLYRIQVIPPVESHRHGCHSMSKTAIGISNRFRKLFGLEPINAHPAIDHPNSNSVESMAATPALPVNDGGMNIMPFPPIPMENVSAQPVHRHSHHRHHHLQKAAFIERLSHALMLLGPWEGRAVAFVLGCGIGVILRMMHVLILVTYRILRGSPQPGEDDGDEEETAVLLVAAPPEYSRDEKAAL